MKGTGSIPRSTMWLEKVGRFIVRWRWLFFAVAVLWVLVGGYLVSQLKLYDEPGRWAPPHHPLVELNRQMEKRFGGTNHVVIQVSVREGAIYQKPALQAIQNITVRLERITGVIPYTIRSLADNNAKFMKFSTFRGDEYIEILPLMERIPKTEAEMERLQWGVRHNPLVFGPLISPDEKAALITADFRTEPFLDSIGNLLPYADPVTIYNQVQETIQEEATTSDNLVIQAGGTPVIIGWVNGEGLRYIEFAFLFFLGVMAASLFFFFRRPAGVLLPLFVGLFSSLSGFTFYYLIFSDVLGSAAALIAPFIVVAAGSCHAVQFLRRFFDEDYPREQSLEQAIVLTFAARFKPMIVSLLTDLIAFVVLAFIPFENVNLLGRVTALGLASVTVAEFFLLMPCLCIFLRTSRRRRSRVSEEVTKLDLWTERVVRLLVNSSRVQITVGVGLIAVVGGSIWLTRYMEFGQDNTYAIHNYLTRSWERNSLFAMEMDIRKHFGGVYPLTIMLKTKGETTVSNDASVLKKIDDFGNYLRSLPGVKEVLGLPEYIKVMHRLMHEDREEYFRVPDDVRAIGEYVYMYEYSEPGVFDSVVSYGHKEAALVAYVSETNYQTVESVVRKAQEYAMTHFNDEKIEAYVGGGIVAVSQAFNESIKKWLILGSGLSLGATYILAVLLLGSVTMPLFLILPLVAGIFIPLAIMYLLDIELNSNATSALAMASGVGIDSEVYLLYRFREEYRKIGNFEEALVVAFTRIRKALVSSNGALILGCWALIPIPLYVGYVGFGMGLVLLSCFVIGFVAAPTLWAVFRPSYLTRGMDEMVVEPEQAVSRR